LSDFFNTVYQAKDSLKETLRKTLTVQTVLTLVAAVIALLTKGDRFALALVYGGAVTIVGTWLHAWRLLKIAATGEENDPALVGAEVFKGAILKLGSMIGLLALGMGVLKLNPLAVVIGFTVAYFGFMFARGYAPRSKPGK
jgi:ATP synthase protein I